MEMTDLAKIPGTTSSGSLVAGTGDVGFGGMAGTTAGRDKGGNDTIECGEGRDPIHDNSLRSRLPGATAPEDITQILEGDHRPVVAASTILPDGPCDPRVVLVEPPALGATAEILLRGGRPILPLGRPIAALFSGPGNVAHTVGLQKCRTTRPCTGAQDGFFGIVPDRPAAAPCNDIPADAHGPEAVTLPLPLPVNHVRRIPAEHGIFVHHRATSRPDDTLRLPVAVHG